MDPRLVTCVHNTGRQYEAGEDPHPGCAADDSAVAARRASVYISCCGGAGVRVVRRAGPPQSSLARVRLLQCHLLAQQHVCHHQYCHEYNIFGEGAY